MESKVVITMVLHCESPKPVNMVNKVYSALRGHGDNRRGKNMKADIGWYVKDKIEENISNADGNTKVKIMSHSYRVLKGEE